MSGIPDDIMKAADSASKDYIHNRGQSLRDVIAASLMQERERCARIAEETPLASLTSTSAPGDPVHHRYMFEVAASAQRSSIVACIRSPALKDTRSGQ